MTVRTQLKAGQKKIILNHNETLSVRTGLQGGKLRRLSVRTGLQAARRAG